MNNSDISSFTENVDALTKQAKCIVNLPLDQKYAPVLRDMGEALDDFQKVINAIQNMPIMLFIARKLEESKPKHPVLVLDTTEAMIQKGHIVPASNFQIQMGWKSRQAVSKALDCQRIFYLEYKAERYFPVFYADPTYERKHLEVITKILGHLPGGSKMQFFLTSKGSLGGATPLQALADGRFSKVKDIAAAFAEV